MGERARVKVLWGVGETLRSLRAARGWTQGQLQAATRAGGAGGVSETAISRIERGEDVPNLTTVDRLLDALGVSFDTFLTMWRQVRGDSVVLDEAEQAATAGSSGDEVFLVWRLLGAMDRDPIEVKRQTKDLVELVGAVRESLRDEPQGAQGAGNGPDKKARETRRRR